MEGWVGSVDWCIALLLLDCRDDCVADNPDPIFDPVYAKAGEGCRDAALSSPGRKQSA